MSNQAITMSQDDEEEPPSRRGALLAMIVIVILVAGGYWLTDILAATSKLQDCVMAGRRNCVLFH